MIEFAKVGAILLQVVTTNRIKGHFSCKPKKISETNTKINNFYLKLGICSDPNNESDPSSEYSLLGLTHVMNHCLGQKFIIWVKINCLDMSLKPGTGIPRPRTADESLYILLEMQHTQIGFHAFKMADKIARKEGHRQVFVEYQGYVNEIAYNSRTASFRFYEDSPLKY